MMGSGDSTVEGTSAPHWVPLREMLARVVAAQGPGGGAVAVWHKGEVVADLASGSYRVGDRQLVFSVAKFVTAVAAQLARSGGLDLDRPIADAWPEFRRSSTAAITIRDVLSHRSGLVSIVGPMTLEGLLAGEGDAAMGRAEPHWAPGTAHGYHSFTYGLLMDGVFRRALGITVGDFVRENIAGPLGIDLAIGDDISRDASYRPVRMPTAPATSMRGWQRTPVEPPDPANMAFLDRLGEVNRPDVLRSPWPSAVCITSAAALARFGAATLASSNALLDDKQHLDLVGMRSYGHDRVLGFPTAFGSGVQRPFPVFPMVGPSSYGHEGAGGSFVVVDPQFELSIGFTTDVFPPVAGASPSGGALLATIRHLAESRS